MEITPFGLNLLDEHGRLVDALSMSAAATLAVDLAAACKMPRPSIPRLSLAYRLSDWWRALWFVRRRAVRELVAASRARNLKSLDGQ